MMQGIREQVRAIDDRLSAQPQTVGMMIARDASRYTAVVGTIAIPATLALFLSIVGIYGVTAFAAAPVYPISARAIGGCA